MTVRLERDADVAVIVLDDPASGNALDLDTARDLRAAVAEAVADASVRAIVLRGDGPRFCVGGDLRTFAAAPVGANLCDVLARPLHEAIELLQTAWQPVVCVVHGAVGGGANGLVLAADLVVAAEGTVFRMGYTGSGLSPDCGVTWELPRRVGMARAMDLVLTNRRLDAAEAQAIGLVSRVLPAADLEAEVAQVLAAFRAVPAETLAESKRLLRRAAGVDLHSHLDDEARTIGRVGDTADTREAIDAFLSKRAPSYSR